MTKDHITKPGESRSNGQNTSFVRVHAQPVPAKGSPRGRPESAAFQDLETERLERQNRTERLREMRLAAEIAKG